MGNVLDKLSLRVEDAVHEIVDIFKESLKEIGITELGAKPKPVEKDREKKTDNRDGKDKEAPKEKTVKPTDEKTLEEEVEELIMHFNHKTFEALLKATRNALDGIKRRVFCTRYLSLLCFTHSCNAILNYFLIFVVPPPTYPLYIACFQSAVKTP